MLEKHEVGLFAGLRRVAVLKAFRMFAAGKFPVLREGRIRNHAVKLNKLAIVLVERVFQHVAKFDVRRWQVVQNEIHLGNGNDAGVVVLPMQVEVSAVTALFADELAALDEHTARADGGIVNGVTLFRVDEPDHQPHHPRGRIKLAALFARAVGEFLDEIFVGRTEQIGKLEHIVDERDAALVHAGGEPVQQILEVAVFDLGLVTDLFVEIDVALQDAVQRQIFILQRADGLVEHRANFLLRILERWTFLLLFVNPLFIPARTRRNEKGFAVAGFGFENFRELGGWQVLVFFAQCHALLIENVRQTLQK